MLKSTKLGFTNSLIALLKPGTVMMPVPQKL